MTLFIGSEVSTMIVYKEVNDSLAKLLCMYFILLFVVLRVEPRAFPYRQSSLPLSNKSSLPLLF